MKKTSSTLEIPPQEENRVSLQTKWWKKYIKAMSNYRRDHRLRIADLDKVYRTHNVLAGSRVCEEKLQNSYFCIRGRIGNDSHLDLCLLEHAIAYLQIQMAQVHYGTSLGISVGNTLETDRPVILVRVKSETEDNPVEFLLDFAGSTAVNEIFRNVNETESQSIDLSSKGKGKKKSGGNKTYTFLRLYNASHTRLKLKSTAGKLLQTQLTELTRTIDGERVLGIHQPYEVNEPAIPFCFRRFSDGTYEIDPKPGFRGFTKTLMNEIHNSGKVEELIKPQTVQQTDGKVIKKYELTLPDGRVVVGTPTAHTEARKKEEIVNASLVLLLRYTDPNAVSDMSNFVNREESKEPSRLLYTMRKLLMNFDKLTVVPKRKPEIKTYEEVFGRVHYVTIGSTNLMFTVPLVLKVKTAQGTNAILEVVYPSSDIKARYQCIQTWIKDQKLCVRNGEHVWTIEGINWAIHRQLNGFGKLYPFRQAITEQEQANERKELNEQELVQHKPVQNESNDQKQETPVSTRDILHMLDIGGLADVNRETKELNERFERIFRDKLNDSDLHKRVWWFLDGRKDKTIDRSEVLRIVKVLSEIQVNEVIGSSLGGKLSPKRIAAKRFQLPDTSKIIQEKWLSKEYDDLIYKGLKATPGIRPEVIDAFVGSNYMSISRLSPLSEAEKRAYYEWILNPNRLDAIKEDGLDADIVTSWKESKRQWIAKILETPSPS